MVRRMMLAVKGRQIQQKSACALPVQPAAEAQRASEPTLAEQAPRVSPVLAVSGPWSVELVLSGAVHPAAAVCAGPLRL